MRSTRSRRARTRTSTTRARTWALTAGPALALLLTACADGAEPAEPEDTRASPPLTTTAAPTPDPTDDAETWTPSPEPSTPSVPTDVPPEVLLTAEVLGAVADAPRETVEVVTPWRLPPDCAVHPPTTATAMRTQQLGDGQYESVIAVQQVAAFPDADVAVAEAARLAAALERCTTAEGSSNLYTVEDVAVGAQGRGLSTGFYGDTSDDALGTYLVVTRRGSAVALVGGEAGERSIGSARDQETAHASAGWELLGRYDIAGS